MPKPLLGLRDGPAAAALSMCVHSGLLLGQAGVQNGKSGEGGFGARI